MRGRSRANSQNRPFKWNRSSSILKSVDLVSLILRFCFVFSFARKTWRAKDFSWRLGNHSAKAMLKCGVRLDTSKVKPKGVHLSSETHTASHQLTSETKKTNISRAFHGRFASLHNHPKITLLSPQFFIYSHFISFTQRETNSATFCFKQVLNWLIAGTQMATTFFITHPNRACFLSYE